MKILYSLFLCCSLVFSGASFGQYPNFKAFLIGDSLGMIKLFEIDAQDNYYVAGQMKDTGYVDTVPNPSARLIADSEDEDFFLAKLDSSGTLIWGGAIGGLRWDHVEAMEIDASGNVYVGGAFEDTADFDIGAGVLQRIAKPYGRDIFLAKYNNAGQIQWVNVIGNGGSYEDLNDLVIDGDGNVIFIGKTYDSTDVDPGPGIHYILTQKWHDIVLVKYNSQGQLIWATNMGGNELDEGHTLSVDKNNNIYIAGDFNDTIYMDSAMTAVHYATTTGYSDYVVAKYNKDGQYIWSKFFGNQHLEEVTNSLVDDKGNLYLLGNYQGTMDFDLSAGVDTIRAISGNSFIAKYDAQGNYQWANVMNGDWTICYGMEFDLFGNITIGGFHYGDMYLDPSSTSLSDTTSAISAFVVSYSQNGNYLNHFSLHNKGASVAWDAKMNSKADFVMAGLFAGEFPIDSNVSFNSTGQADGFIASFSLGCNSFYDSLNMNICSGDSIIVGGIYRNSSGIYIDTISQVNSCVQIRTVDLIVNPTWNTTLNSEICQGESYQIGNKTFNQTGTYQIVLQSKFGCDSLTNLNLVVKEVDLSYSQTVPGGPEILVSNMGDSILWIDCSTGIIIPGAKGISYTASSNGSFAFIKYQNGCVDTSECIAVVSIGQNEFEKTGFKVFPNPVEDELILDFGDLKLDNISKVYVFNQLGEKMAQYDIQIARNKLNVKHMQSGWYILRFYYSEDSYSASFYKR